MHQNSVDTKNPVRVVRGFKDRSECGSREGSVGGPLARSSVFQLTSSYRYRYYGLYQVTDVGQDHEIREVQKAYYHSGLDRKGTRPWRISRLQVHV